MPVKWHTSTFRTAVQKPCDITEFEGDFMENEW